MWDSVLGWWLAFTQSGLTPARTDTLSWRTVNFCHDLKKDDCITHCLKMDSRGNDRMGALACAPTKSV